MATNEQPFPQSVEPDPTTMASEKPSVPSGGQDAFKLSSREVQDAFKLSSREVQDVKMDTGLSNKFDILMETAAETGANLCVSEVTVEQKPSVKKKRPRKRKKKNPDKEVKNYTASEAGRILNGKKTPTAWSVGVTAAFTDKSIFNMAALDVREKKKKKRQRQRKNKKNSTKKNTGTQQTTGPQTTGPQTTGPQTTETPMNTDTPNTDTPMNTEIVPVTAPMPRPGLTVALKPSTAANRKRKRRLQRKKMREQGAGNIDEIMVTGGKRPLEEDDDATPTKRMKLSTDEGNSTVQVPTDNASPTVSKRKRRKRNRKKNPNANISTNGSTDLTTIHKAILNPSYSAENRKSEIRSCWSGNGSLASNGTDEATVIKDPFTCCYLPAFLSDPVFLGKVKEELQGLEMINKNNDLYKFKQTADLKTVTTPHIAGLRQFLFGQFREWLIQVTGIPLNDTVDMGCSKYEHTDVLLCHDDELEGRRIAFILYLVPFWSHDDGGTLDFFDTDEHGQPRDVVHSLVPEWNSFAFFEVSPVSFHQVSEVFAKDKVRLSINGWFHGPPIQRPQKYLPPPIPLTAPGHVQEEEVYSWINPLYLDPNTQRQVRHKFSAESALQLDNFLAGDKFEELAAALRDPSLAWVKVGPANKQSGQVLEPDTAPEVVKSVRELLRSEAMFLVLSQLTGLKLHTLAPPDSDPDSDEEMDKETEPNPRSSVSIRHWGPGSYTLLRDNDQATTSALDAHFFINVHQDWTQDHGGFVSYITKDKDEELLTVIPRGNCLSLVYRDAQTLKFNKHINSRVSKLSDSQTSYQTLTGVYYE